MLIELLYLLAGQLPPEYLAPLPVVTEQVTILAQYFPKVGEVITVTRQLAVVQEHGLW